MSGRSNTKFWIIFAVATGVVLMLALALSLVLLLKHGDQVVINSKSSNINGHVQISIGTLRGTFEVNSMSVPDGERISLPYEMAVDEGTLTLYVERAGNVVWEEEIDSEKSGAIELDQAGTYTIYIHTDEGKGIMLDMPRPHVIE
ncbi:hypothetical protein E2L07_12545 [Halalkalibacterium halodurans]|uniref:hypothetical protein n=1 Tax=Halalkalibacterium halodurans TaxID=86665 RepID=UPI001067323B|nr:hypothetical protein [Halalkalibacterium halodurans]TES53627.1 hypothetical protein E2L07_12545 [Halalkalibacterium halodurans]